MKSFVYYLNSTYFKQIPTLLKQNIHGDIVNGKKVVYNKWLFLDLITP